MIQVALGHLAVIARDLHVANQLIPEAYEFLRARKVDCPQWAESLVTFGDLLSLKNDNKNSFDRYEEAMAVRERLWGPHSVRLAKERYELAMSLAQVGRFAQAVQEMKQAYQAMAAALGPQHFNSAVIELQLGLLQASIGVESGGEIHVKHAADIILSQPDDVDKRMVFQAHSVLAEVALFYGQFELAGPHLAAAFKLQQELRDRLPLDGRIQTAMAWYLDDIGQDELARQSLFQVRDELIKRLGAQHPYAEAVDDAIATSYISAGKWQDAEHWLATLKKGPGRAMSTSTDVLVALLLLKEQYASAEPILENRYKSMRNIPRADQYRLSVFGLEDQMGRVKYGLGRWAEARKYFERAVQTLSNGQPHNPYLAMTRARYGLCLLSLGDRVGAVKQAELAAKTLRVGSGLARRFYVPLDQLRARLGEER